MAPTLPGSVARLLAIAALAAPALAQTVTVTTTQDTVDIDWSTATIADLPGPDGLISLSEALVATNNTAGHQTIGFAIPTSDPGFGFLLPGRAVFTALTGFFWRANDEVTIDGTTQTAFAGDTNPDGNEVALYGNEIYLNVPGCTLIGFDSTSVSAVGPALIEGNTGSMNITLGGGSGSTVRGNTGGTIKIDRSNDNLVVGNTVQRVRVLGFGASQPAVGNQIGGPALEDRNFITGYGFWNSEGVPSGQAVQLVSTVGTVVENNWIGTTTDGLSIGNLACTIGISVESSNSDLVIRDNRIAGIRGVGQFIWAGYLFGRAVLVSGTGSGLTMTGNTIGLDANGDPVLGSVQGIDLGDPVTNPLSMTDIVIGGALPGEGNEIAGHVLNGVLVGRNTAAVRLAGNAIHDNGTLGIDLIPSGYGYGVSQNDPLDADTGGNGVQNFPDLAAVLRQEASLRVLGDLHSSPGDDFTLEFFASPECDASGFGEGQQPLGTTAVTADAFGDAAFDVTLPVDVPDGWWITATATLEPLGTTSEFSACVATPWRDEGYALDGTGGDPLLTGEGDLSADSVCMARLTNAAPSSIAALFLALDGNPTPFKGGTLAPVPPIGGPVFVGTDGDGSIPLPFVMPPGIPAGVELWWQWAIQDAGAVFGVALSNALVGTTP